MDINTKLFKKINGLAGKSELSDAFGRAGAEFVIIAMVGWFVAADYLERMPDKKSFFLPLAYFAAAWICAWLLSLLIGRFTREVRPYAAYPDTKLLFKPLSFWKTFPSDHSMSAFLIVFLAIMFGLPGVWALLIMALWVCWGRVYCGVHYPLDILGGLSLAALLSAAANYIYVFIR